MIGSLFLIPVCLVLSFQKPPGVEALQVLPTADYFGTAWAENQAKITPTVTASPLPSATPTLLVLPTPTATVWKYDPLFVASPIPEVFLQSFSLSFYDPHIGYYFPDKAAINCLEFDFSINDCVSKVHHGLDNYFEWYGKGAACPAALAYDTVFRVVEPVQLAGYWRCIDVGQLDVNGHQYIDFMLRYPDSIWTGDNLNNFPWSSEVRIEIISIP